MLDKEPVADESVDTTKTNNDIVIGGANRGLRYRLRGWRKFVLLVVIILFAAGGGVLYLTQKEAGKKTQQTAGVAPAPNTKVPEPTAEQKHTINETTRGEGSVTAVTESSITLNLKGQKTPLTLKTNDKTLYSAGSNGFPAKRSTIKSGQKAIVAYDKQRKTVLSIWVNYDAK